MTTRLLVFNGTAARSEPQPYGLETMEGLGYELVVPPPGRVPGKVRDVVHHRWGVQVGQPGLRAARGADVVLAYLEPNIAYPALASRVPGSPLARRPLVGIFCWAAEELRTADKVRRRRLQRMLAACDVVGFFSSNQADVLVAHGVPRARLALLPFGIDTTALATAAGRERDIDVLSVGWDRGRDYPTLLRALAGTGTRAQVVAPPDRFADQVLPGEVTVLGTVPHAEYRDLLARARVVVVPTHDLAYPTGQTVAMEAAAAGCAVVVSRTAAMEDYFTDTVTAEMPEVGDADGLRARVRALLDDPGRRGALAARSTAHALEHFDHVHLWRALDRELRARRLAGPPLS
ncbi:glycosyltransferase family protein [Nocardioides zeicaulis]|uniref:Glycosyltransferase n=1 Tax=Nocardioides zeicaulis TaxID=1776857 RepID=A0ABV6DZS3_9ACTN